jgi:hypothetical protein
VVRARIEDADEYDLFGEALEKVPFRSPVPTFG